MQIWNVRPSVLSQDYKPSSLTCFLMALTLVKYKPGYWLASLTLFVSLVLTDSSLLWWQQILAGPAVPGVWPGGFLPYSVSVAVSWGSAGQRLREAAGEEGPAGWWERDQRPLLAHRQPITPCPSRRGGQASLSFLPHVLAHQLACRPITTDFSFPGCIFTSLHLVKKKVSLWSGETVYFAVDRAWRLNSGLLQLGEKILMHKKRSHEKYYWLYF